MTDRSDINPGWDLALESKPDFSTAMQRIYAWFEQAIIDRPPVRFTRHNAEYEVQQHAQKSTWKTLKDRWFDAEYQLEWFTGQIEGKHFHGETFPIFWPNLGPNVFAALYGCPLEFGEVTSWAEPILPEYDRLPALDWQSEYLRKLEEMTNLALQACEGNFLVGYTDLHPGIDCLAALRGSDRLCFDLYEYPNEIKQYLQTITQDFLQLFEHFDMLLKARQQPSVTWMAIPSFGKLHIPSCDFSTMISKRHFEEFVYPVLEQEAQAMTHNIFHVDGKGVARHLDRILELPNVQAIQWVQGVGDDQPILQWIPLIKRIQAAGKSVVVDLEKQELEGFIDALEPEGLLLCLASEGEAEEEAMLKRVAKW